MTRWYFLVPPKAKLLKLTGRLEKGSYLNHAGLLDKLVYLRDEVLNNPPYLIAKGFPRLQRGIMQ